MSIIWLEANQSSGAPRRCFFTEEKEKSNISSLESQALYVHHWQKHSPRTHRHFSVFTTKHFVLESYSYFTLTLTVLGSEDYPWYTAPWKQNSVLGVLLKSFNINRSILALNPDGLAVHHFLQFGVMILLPFNFCNLLRQLVSCVLINLSLDQNK